MNFSLQRSQFQEDGIFGSVRAEDDSVQFVTLEHAFPYGPDEDDFEPAIPVGIYNCERRRSPKFGYDLFIVLNVPNHDFIEIHVGNTNADSIGCILLGESIQSFGKDFMITNSKKSFDKFMEIQEGINEFTLTVLN